MVLVLFAILFLWLSPSSSGMSYATTHRSNNTSCTSDPPHGPDATLTDILNHIRFDRNYMGLDNKPLDQDIQILLLESAQPRSSTQPAERYATATWTCSGTGASRTCSAPSYTMPNQNYVLKYYPEFQDWDVIPWNV